VAAIDDRVFDAPGEVTARAARDVAARIRERLGTVPR
jgi:hypothetical protein